jgi:glycosyltransferase involved in cell wall biosynthesis
MPADMSSIPESKKTLRKPRLLIAVDWFAPSIRAGGPVRSCVNLVELLGDLCDIAIVAGDRDLGDRGSFASVPLNQWTDWNGKAQVFYATPDQGKFAAFRRAVSDFAPDTVYLNGVFSSGFTVAPLLRQRSWRNQERVVLASRGMLKPSALNRKGWKKKPLLKLLRYSKVMNNVVFHATTSDETAEICREFGASASVVCAPNVPCVPNRKLAVRDKAVGGCRLCYVGRIHPIKNLLLFLRQLRCVNGRCTLEVIGPVEDQAYFDKCKAVCALLPANVRVNFLGVRTPDEIRQVLCECDASVLPTEGENFGHAIFESFAVGVPALISDQTMWRDLVARNAGWDLPLSHPEQFGLVVNQLCGMTASDLNLWRQGALDLADEFVSRHDFREGYSNMFFSKDAVDSDTGVHESGLTSFRDAG